MHTHLVVAIREDKGCLGCFEALVGGLRENPVAGKIDERHGALEIESSAMRFVCCILIY